MFHILLAKNKSLLSFTVSSYQPHQASKQWLFWSSYPGFWKFKLHLTMFWKTWGKTAYLTGLISHERPFLQFTILLQFLHAVSSVGMALGLKHIVETSLITVSFCSISCTFCLNSDLKQQYISTKTEHFNYKSGCGMTHIETFKRKAGLSYR